MTSGIYSYGFACVVFLLLFAQLGITRNKHGRHRHIQWALSASLLWAVFYLVMTVKPAPVLIASGIPDTLRILAWAGFINALLQNSRSEPDQRLDVSTIASSMREFMSGKLFYASFIIIAVQLALITAAATGFVRTTLLGTLLPLTWIFAPLLCMILLERLYTATPQEKRTTIRVVTLGLGTMCVYDFYLFANVLLFKQVPLDTWHARGFLYGLLIPLVAYYAAKNPQWSIPLHLSRQVVTGSATFLAAGTYLIATAFAASLIRFEKFEGASVIQITFVLLAIVLLLVVLTSKKFRAECRVFVSKNFYNLKYDYRREWLKFTEKLSEQLDEAPKAILHAMCDIVESDAGEIWGKNSNNRYICMATRGTSPADGNRLLARDIAPIAEFLKRTKWLIDVDEYVSNPEHYGELELPGRLILHGRVWLIVPLPVMQNIIGFVLIDRSGIVRTTNWEDRDLLKSAGHQAAGFLAQQLAHQALEEAGQFEAFNRLSAYIVHDLKNILGQQSLIVSNAEKHKSNPEFVNDVISTIDNSVQRMQKLLIQLREPDVPVPVTRINLIILIQRVVEDKASNEPVPVFTCEETDIPVLADQDKLERVFGHIVQNAQEATPRLGKVEITLTHHNHCALVEIVDTGKGMSEEFMARRLFKAFESTKGLTGMGIGLFESREYIQDLGGNITVASHEENGSCFSVELPVSNEPTV